MNDFELSAIQEDVYRAAKVYMDNHQIPIITQKIIMEGIYNRFQTDAFNEMAKAYPALTKLWDRKEEKEENKDTQKDSSD